MAESTEMADLGRENVVKFEDEKLLKPKDSGFGYRRYAVRKSAAQGMMDLALLMANCSQLKSVLDQGKSYDYYLFLVVMISLSIALQVLTGFVLIWLVSREKRAKMDNSVNRGTERLNTLTTAMILLIMVINAFISAFGISPAQSTSQVNYEDTSKGH